MRALDLFSGRRTALAAFKDWDIDHVDIIDGIDIKDYTPERVYDFIWASPPCTEYSLARPRRSYLVPDRELWIEALRVIDRGKKYGSHWVIENVCGAQRWWGRPKEHCGSWYFWGWYPKVRFPKDPPIKDCKYGKKDPLWRARIPYEISEAFYKALKK